MKDGAETQLWRLQLTVLSGPDTGKRCVVDRDSVLVGKLPECDLVLSDPTVSRRHLQLLRDPQGWQLIDLGSTNGCYVDGAQVRQARVSGGAVLRAGQVEIAFAPELEAAEVPPWPEPELEGLIGGAPAMRRLFGLIDRVAPTNATVLITGETGVGKGAVARALHRRSTRAQAPYVVVDCQAVQRQLVESELFGHERGAFSGAYDRRRGAFELASGGTVLLDELGELELDLQPKLLRVLDARELRRLGGDARLSVDLRVIAASRRDLAREVQRGAFREDLFFRVSVVTLRLPPLRERAEDIPALAERFLHQIAEARGLPPPHLDAAAIDRLTSHDWPGNVRELKNTMERAVLMAAVRPGAGLALGGLTEVRGPRPAPSAPAQALSFDPTESFKQAKQRWMQAHQRQYLTWLLAAHDGNLSAAARAAQMDRKYLHKLVQRLGLS